VAGAADAGSDACAAAIPLTLAPLAGGGFGTTFTADTSTGTALYEGSCASFSTGGKELVYSLHLATAQRLNFSSHGASGVDPVIYVRNSPCATGTEVAGACADNTIGGKNETLTGLNLTAGDYLLFVDSYSSSSSGSQTVTVSVGVPESCTTAVAAPKTDGGFWRIDLSTFVHNSTGVSCGDSAGPDAVYSLTTTGTHSVTVVAAPVGASSSEDPYIFIRRSPCSTGTQVACQDVGYSGATETLVQPALAAGTYYIFVGAWGGSPGPTDISVLVGP
jgi:hypothetical protein